MILALDIGNSNIVAGLYDGQSWKHVWRFLTLEADQEAYLYYHRQLADCLLEYAVPAEDVRQIILSSVVPPLTPVWMELCKQIFQLDALLLGPDLYPRIGLSFHRPSEIGTDLVANAAAAVHLYQQDCIVVDFGTALTLTTVRKTGEILGVAIAPGLKTAIYSLFQKTAQLPEVPLELPPSPIGKNTVHAIQSGVLLGYVGLVKHLLEATRHEAGAHYIAVATGGLSSVLHPLEGVFEEINPNLTLEGLRIILEKVWSSGS